MKRVVKLTVGIACVLALAAMAVYTALQPLVVEAVTLGAETVSLTFTETGSYEYSRTYSVYPLVSGEILEVSVREGDRVQAGDLLAVVSATDYEHQIQQLNSTIAGLGGQLQNLSLQEQQEKASLNASLQNLEGQLAVLDAEIAANKKADDSLESQIRTQEWVVEVNRNSVRHAREYLREMRDYGDDYEILLARQAYANAQNALAQNLLLLEQLENGGYAEEIYEEQRQSMESQIELIRQQLEQSYTGGMAQYYNAQITAAQQSIEQMEEMAGKAAIRTPVDGVIQYFPTQDQNLLSQQSAAATIGDAPCVEVYVPTREIDGIAVGDTVELLLDKRLDKETINGTIFDIGEKAEVRLSALGVEERKVRVLIRPAQSGLQIGYGMDVRFSPYTFEDVLVVPKTAVFQWDGGDYVWAVQDGSAQRREIEKGVETRDGFIITSGLQEQDVVIVDADNGSLSPNRKVRY